MTEQLDRRAELTRLQILQAAARQFAHTPYSLVSLDDILADATVTKGALYFHFRSKHALAVSLVEHRTARANKSVEEVLARNLSGAETLIDLSCLVAAEDIGDPMARACLNLVESIGRTDDLGPRVLDEWVQGFAGIAKRAIGEGDFTADSDPEAIARLLVSIYLGVRQTSDLDDPRGSSPTSSTAGGWRCPDSSSRNGSPTSNSSSDDAPRWASRRLSPCTPTPPPMR